jgi:hypothetical protein
MAGCPVLDHHRATRTSEVTLCLEGTRSSILLEQGVKISPSKFPWNLTLLLSPLSFGVTLISLLFVTPLQNN